MGSDSRLLITVLENGTQNAELFGKLESLIPLLGGTMGLVKRAYWINNPRLATQFELFLECTAARHELNPNEFQSGGWKYASTDLELKTAFMAKLQDYTGQVSHLQLPRGVIPMIQGTQENAGHRIAKNGFGILATLDPGYYGQGIYLTSKMPYAFSYAKEAQDQTKVFMVCLTVPGNALPITAAPYSDPTPFPRIPNSKGFLASPCQRGYQSHYTVVTKANKATEGYPMRESPIRESFDELVVFEPAQALPVFLVFMSNPGV